jgi:copper chaperone NosL
MNKLSTTSRIIIGLASLALIATYFVPVWFIFLIAPQYPEGLTLNIWLYKLTGQVEIINGLNHYIGMKHISAEMFPELKFLVYVVAFFIAFGLFIAFTGRRRLLLVYLALTIAGGAAAMYDMYRWGYNYGHDLDPKAAIQVPGLSYQPPLIGHKMLLNFDAYSYPGIGGWIVIGVGVVFFLVWIYEWRKGRKRSNSIAALPKKAVAAIAILCTLAACENKPAPISYGKDACDECRMTIMDPRFGAEIVTTRGRVFKFDDVHCIAKYVKAGKTKQEDIAQIVFVNYRNNNEFIDANTAIFVASPQLKSPMNSNAAAFRDQQSANAAALESKGRLTTWAELLKTN